MDLLPSPSQGCAEKHAVRSPECPVEKAVEDEIEDGLRLVSSARNRAHGSTTQGGFGTSGRYKLFHLSQYAIGTVVATFFACAHLSQGR